MLNGKLSLLFLGGLPTEIVPLLFGERYHKDPVWAGIETLGGWAWANSNGPQDYLYSSRVPVNFNLAGQAATQANT